MLSNDLVQACGDVPVHFRIAHMAAITTAADGEVSEEEEGSYIETIQTLFNALGLSDDTEAAAEFSYEQLSNSELFLESLSLFGQHLPKEGLQDIYTILETAADGDGGNAEEDDFLSGVRDAWAL